jgi:hypothetical protein
MKESVELCISGGDVFILKREAGPYAKYEMSVHAFSRLRDVAYLTCERPTPHGQILSANKTILYFDDITLEK